MECDKSSDQKEIRVTLEAASLSLHSTCQILLTLRFATLIHILSNTDASNNSIHFSNGSKQLTATPYIELSKWYVQFSVKNLA